MSLKEYLTHLEKNKNHIVRKRIEKTSILQNQIYELQKNIDTISKPYHRREREINGYMDILNILMKNEITKDNIDSYGIENPPFIFITREKLSYLTPISKKVYIPTLYMKKNDSVYLVKSLTYFINDKPYIKKINEIYGPCVYWNKKVVNDAHPQISFEKDIKVVGFKTLFEDIYVYILKKENWDQFMKIMERVSKDASSPR